MTTPGCLHASDSDGDSSYEGAFLTLSADIIHEHLAYRSFRVTQASRAAFVEACAHGKRIWVNGRSAPCLFAKVLDNGSAVQVEIPLDTMKFPFADYYLVSAKPVRYTAQRELNEQERRAIVGDAGAAAIRSAGFPATTIDLGHAKAVNGKNLSLVFVSHGTDRDGNRLTYVFSVAAGQVTYAGKLPDWPEKLLDIDGVPQAIVNLQGDARIIEMFLIRPSVEAQMFAGEGG
jgi:hypothetical protein